MSTFATPGADAGRAAEAGAAGVVSPGMDSGNPGIAGVAGAAGAAGAVKPGIGVLIPGIVGVAAGAAGASGAAGAVRPGSKGSPPAGMRVSPQWQASGPER